MFESEISKQKVTPFVGVWIETVKVKKRKSGCMSHPSWVCGLKPISKLYLIIQYFVTPFVGVWIETLARRNQYIKNVVTPFVGVWIETVKVKKRKSGCMRHTLRGCVD